MRFLDLDVNWEFTTRKIKLIFIRGRSHNTSRFEGGEGVKKITLLGLRHCPLAGKCFILQIKLLFKKGGGGKNWEIIHSSLIHLRIGIFSKSFSAAWIPHPLRNGRAWGNPFSNHFFFNTFFNTFEYKKFGLVRSSLFDNSPTVLFDS